MSVTTWSSEGPVLGERRVEGGREVLGRLDAPAAGAVGAAESGEVGAAQRRSVDAVRAAEGVLVHDDGAVMAVVAHDDDQRQLVPHGRRQFLAGHHEAAIADEGHDARAGRASAAPTAAGTA